MFAKLATRLRNLHCLIALCSYPHVNVEIRDLSQTFTTAPIFPQYNYFRQNIWGNIWFQFHFHKLKQYQASSSKSLHLILQWVVWGRVECCINKPKVKLQIFQKLFSDETGEENIWEIFAPRTAAQMKLFFSSFFSARPHCSTHQILDLSDQPFMFFANKCTNSQHICTTKYL